MRANDDPGKSTDSPEAPKGRSDELARLRAELAAERELRAQLKQALDLRDAALDAASTLFMIIDAKAPDYPIVYVNRALASLHGFSDPEDLIGKSVSVLVGMYFPEDKRESLRKAMHERRAVRVEVEKQESDGSKSWLGISAVPISSARGEVTHFVTLAADITSRLEAERKREELQQRLVDEMQERERMVIELRLAQKLESIGRLAAGLAHEINTPTQYVSDSVYFLQSAFEQLRDALQAYREAVDSMARPAQSPELLDRLTELEASTDLAFVAQEVPSAFARTCEGLERIAGIVRAMREFAYPDLGERSPADINHAIETTLAVARSEYKYVATVTHEFAPLPTVLCNISELNQVFLNLIVNAAHAIQDAGKDVSSGQIAIATRTAGATHVEISISDNGCGIRGEDLDKIFDPFFTTKEVGRGTGQGLAIARSIVVEKHGGTISVSSQEGRGTTIVVRLPVNSAALENVAA